MEQDNFTVLENKAIGRNFSTYRKILGMKASDLAERLGMPESSYSRYERGETPITVELIQQVSDVFKVSPLALMSATPGNIIKNSSNFAVHGYFNNQTTNEQQMQAVTKALENMVALTERLITLLDKKDQ
jgi:transcriptional regulator with XRE-family HTH domain